MSETLESTTNLGFNVPSGYVLVEKAIYEMLLDKVKKGNNLFSDENIPVQAKPIYLKVLRQHYLGDVKMQLNAGEIIKYIPRHSITAKGKEERKLDSFLITLNKQDPKSVKYNPDFVPVFEVFKGNVETIGDNIVLESEEERIAREENFGDAATKKTDIGITGLDFVTTPQPTNDLPPRGSEERKQLIRDRGMDRLEQTAKKSAGLSIEDGPQTVQDFKVTQGPQSMRIISKIKGPGAEAKEVIELKEKGR